MFVRDAMCAQAEWIQPTVTLQEAAQKMRDAAIGCLPVGEHDRLIGMVTDHDLVWRGCADGVDPRTTAVRGIMTKGIVWCYDDDEIDTAINKMATKQIHHLPVINHAKRLVGVLSLSDLATHAPAEMAPRLKQLAARDTGMHAARQPTGDDFEYEDPYV